MPYDCRYRQEFTSWNPWNIIHIFIFQKFASVLLQLRPWSASIAANWYHFLLIFSRLLFRMCSPFVDIAQLIPFRLDSMPNPYLIRIPPTFRPSQNFRLSVIFRSIRTYSEDKSNKLFRSVLRLKNPFETPVRSDNSSELFEWSGIDVFSLKLSLASNLS